MAYAPLTRDQYQKAVDSGFSQDQIIEFEKRRKSSEEAVNTAQESPMQDNNPQIQRQNILGQLLNVPAATSRAAIQANPALSIAGPLAGLVGLSGLGGKEAKQAAGLGAARPDQVKTFQNLALESASPKTTSVGANFVGGIPASVGGLAADMAVDPAGMLMNLIPALMPGKVSATSSAIDKPFMKAVKVGTRGIKRSGDIEKIKINARSAVESIVDNKNNLKLSDINGLISEGKLPESLDEFSQAISQTKKQIFNNYDAALKTAGKSGVTVPLRPIADEIVNAVADVHIEDLSPTVQNYGMQLAQRLEKRGSYTLTEAQDTIEALNNKLKTYFLNPTPEGLHQAVIDRAVVNNLRNSLVKAVESKTGPGYDILRRQYGNLNAIEENVTKSAIRNSGVKGGSLERIFDTFSSGDIVNGIISMNPALVAKGGFQVAARKVFSSINNPNNIIKNMFSNVDRIKNIDPAKRLLMHNLSKIAPSVTMNSANALSRPQNQQEVNNIVGGVSGSSNVEATTVKGYEQIKSDEGFRGKVYRDTLGVPTIGYGFNVNEPSIRKMLPPDVLSGKRDLNKEEANNIFDKAYDVAYKDASKYVGSNVFNKLSDSQQDVLVNMSYAMGSNKLNGFKRLKKALIDKNYEQASKEILNSKWAGQVKGRANRLAKQIKNY